ncbi:MAG: hypothetical protein CSA62_08480 [Planctomycetota bacterium]|nr:MAG: hypothetical protein CSA62_08480 [Planctomycetota bacterium]
MSLAALRTCLLLCLALSASTLNLRAKARHPGAPIFMEMQLFQDRIELRIVGEQEVILPQWLGLELAGYEKNVSAADTQRATKKARAFFEKYGELRLGKQKLSLESFKVDFPESLNYIFQKPGIRLSARFPLTGVPPSVSIRWLNYKGIPALYSEPEIPVTTQWRDQVDFSRLSKNEPEHIWHANKESARARPKITLPPPPPPPTWRLPLLSLGLILVGAIGFALVRGHKRWLFAALPLLSSLATWQIAVVEIPSPFPATITVPLGDEARQLFEQLHKNLYMAFQGDSEEEIYELLAASVCPKLIDELYGEIYESLVLRSEGGAVCTITKLEQLDGGVKDSQSQPPGFEVDWHWRVHGEVSHWGHRHERTNEYRALYQVEHDGRSWKIASVEILSQRRIDQ